MEHRPVIALDLSPISSIDRIPRSILETRELASSLKESIWESILKTRELTTPLWDFIFSFKTKAFQPKDMGLFQLEWTNTWKSAWASKWLFNLKGLGSHDWLEYLRVIEKLSKIFLGKSN